MDKAQKFTLEHDGKSVMLIGTFKDGKPTGQLTVTVDGGEAQEVESPFDGEPEAVAEEV